MTVTRLVLRPLPGGALLSSAARRLRVRLCLRRNPARRHIEPLKTFVSPVSAAFLNAPTTFAVVDPEEVNRLLFCLSDEEEDDTTLPDGFGLYDKVVAGDFPVWSRPHPRQRTSNEDALVLTRIYVPMHTYGCAMKSRLLNKPDHRVIWPGNQVCIPLDETATGETFMRAGTA